MSKPRWQQITESVTLPEVFAHLGLGNLRHGKRMRSPLREDADPSFAAWFFDGSWKWKDYGTNTGGDVIRFWREYHCCSHREAIDALYRVFFHGRYVDTPMPRKRATEASAAVIVPLNWHERVSKLTDEQLAHLAEWRGYPLEFCHWMREKRLIGSYGGNFCFPVIYRGMIARVHVRWKSGAWSYRPDVEIRSTPLVIGRGSAAHVFESQWDMFAVMCLLSMDYVAKCKWIATRGASGRAQVTCHRVIAYPQRDLPGEKWLEKQRATDEIWTPEGVKDANEWLKSDKNAMRKALEMKLL